MTPATHYDGVVVSVQGQNPGPGSGITYTVAINMGSGSPREIAGVTPSDRMLPDEIWTIAASPGKPVQCFDIAGTLIFLIKETFAWTASCDEP